MDKKYVLEDDCKELRNEAYKNLEFIVSTSESALTTTIKSEIRHSEMRTKAYIDSRLTKLNDDFKAYIDQKLEAVIDAIKLLKT
jgi:hypothetical protein